MSDSDWDFCDSESDLEKHTKDEHKYCFDQAIPASKLENLAHRPKASQCQPPGHHETTATKLVTQPVVVFSDRLSGMRCGKTLEGMGISHRASDLPKSFLKATATRFSSEQLKPYFGVTSLESRPYFFAGSFIFPATLNAATGGVLALEKLASEMMCPATLRGYELRCVSWSEFPAIIPSSDPDALVQGMMVINVPQSQRAKIHRFEGGMFDLKPASVNIELVDGIDMKQDVAVYVWNGGHDKLCPKSKKWSPEMLLSSKWHRQNVSVVAEDEDNIALL
ncbi:hypothetical protein Vi05172_g6321 [Venturia inaequalis]|uniref:Gamma-glutamylcyclotransferase AIG2-like domain-containing protein n=1 Tax=Venturia inaequalis TaxID=5025 RepID=A0A8H3VI10_VENIN|nr:hypothetical protein EG327_003091 [Venturia inaequalis]RDI83746.1 hypothetical protein Vi05172_g6321 [Venturia inaequalis]